MSFNVLGFGAQNGVSLYLQDRLVISICNLQSMCLSANCLENVSCELILYLLKALGYSYDSL
jgi:hypothetical protein